MPQHASNASQRASYVWLLRRLFAPQGDGDRLLVPPPKQSPQKEGDRSPLTTSASGRPEPAKHSPASRSIRRRRVRAKAAHP
jgi:hypothetical protein